MLHRRSLIPLSHVNNLRIINRSVKWRTFEQPNGAQVQQLWREILVQLTEEWLKRGQGQEVCRYIPADIMDGMELHGDLGQGDACKGQLSKSLLERWHSPMIATSRATKSVPSQSMKTIINSDHGIFEPRMRRENDSIMYMLSLDFSGDLV